MDTYISVEEFKATYFYGIDTTALQRAGIPMDAFILQQLKLAKQEIVRRCRQNIEETSITDIPGTVYTRMEGNDKWSMVLPNYPIKTVTGCQVNYGWGSQMYNFAHIMHTYSRKLGLAGDLPNVNCDLMVDRDKGIAYINPSSLTLLSSLGQSPLWQQNFSEGALAVSFAYIYGYATIPLDIVAANGMIAAIMIGEAAAGRPSGGATSIRIGSVSRTWGNRAYQSLFDRYAQQVEEILNYYKVNEVSI